MGIQNFSKVFEHGGEKKIKDLRDKTIAIDGSTEIYRAALGMKSIKGLTDSSGRPTLHISTIINNIISYKTNNVGQIWVFDNDESNAAKKLELAERRRQKEKAKKKLEQVRKNKETAKKKKTEEETLFSDSEDEEIKKLDDEEQKLEKQTFRPPAWMFADIKFILDMLGISYIESPKGYEAECIAARLTHRDVSLADAVLSQDTDPILFKAAVLIRRIPRQKKFYQYVYKDIVEEHDLNHTQLIKIAMVMGCDFYKDSNRPISTRLFHGIGAKTVIKRIKSPNMDQKFKDPEVKDAMKYIKRKCKMDSLKWHNRDEEPYKNQENIKLLLNWLVEQKSFSRTIWTERFKKAGIQET